MRQSMTARMQFHNEFPHKQLDVLQTDSFDLGALK